MIKLKGMASSMVRCVVPENLPNDELLSAFEGVAKKSGKMLKGAKVVLDFQGRSLSEDIICNVLTKFIWPSSFEVVSWISFDVATQELLKRVQIPVGEPANVEKTEGQNMLAPSLLLRRTLRSGQKIEHRGDVVVCGHVNDGAEIFASGHVVVLGRLHGLVHAGYEGDEGASIAARSMEAKQVRIAGHVGALERDASWWGEPVLVTVEEGSVLMGEWPA